MNYHKKFLFTVLIVALVMPVTGFAFNTDPKSGNNQDQEEVKQEAREDSVGKYDDENKVNDPFMLEDQMLLPRELEGEDRANTSYITNSTTTETDKVQNGEDDSNSAMSFNFIYYIIDKFKLADPMD